MSEIKEIPLPPTGGKWKQDPKTGKLVKVGGTTEAAPAPKRPAKKEPKK